MDASKRLTPSPVGGEVTSKSAAKVGVLGAMDDSNSRVCTVVSTLVIASINLLSAMIFSSIVINAVGGKNLETFPD